VKKNASPWRDCTVRTTVIRLPPHFVEHFCLQVAPKVMICEVGIGTNLYYKEPKQLKLA